MDFGEDSSRFGALPSTTSRNMSSSSSVFFSANQSPFFSPRSPACQLSESTRSEANCDSLRLSTDPNSSSSGIPDPNVRYVLSEMSPAPAACVSGSFQPFDQLSSATGISNSAAYSNAFDNSGYFEHRERLKKHNRNYGVSSTSGPVSLSSNRMRSCDVFIGLHGRKPSLLRFVNWLRAELEVQGISCFISDRARLRKSHKHSVVEKAMDVSSFGVIIITSKSFKNRHTIEELRLFSGKKNLVPIFFDLSPSDCLIRDIVERRGELWEKNGGELWLQYGGIEKEWREAVHGLSRNDEWKLEAQDGNWRDCILRAVTLLATKLGRRSVVDRLTKWREKVEKEEFPIPRNENFIGRKKELSELEFILFGDISGDSERDYFELRARPRRKQLTIGWGNKVIPSVDRRRERQLESRRKGKEPVVWKESEKEIEMQSSDLPQKENQSKAKGNGRYPRRKRSSKILYGKGIACVSGDPGIGKTELLLEFAYRYHQRYKMVLWIGGENRYIRQNYLNLWSFLEVDVGIENCSEKSRTKSFEEQEEAAVARIRKELMRNIPFLVIIDNLDSEKDWWDHKLVMDLLPRFGAETHIIISTRLPRAVNLEPLKLLPLSGVEAMALMQGNATKDYPITEIDALRSIEEKLNRSTLGLAIVGAILSELPIIPSRLLETTNRMPMKDFSSYGGRETHPLRRNTFLLQLFEVCFSIFDHADGPRSLATRMVQASGWFAPAAIPINLLAQAAHKIPQKHRRTRLWRKLLRSLTCGLASPYNKRSEAEASSMLLRFGLARSSTKPGCIHISELVKLYARTRAVTGVPQAVVQSIISRGSVSIPNHTDHIWAACFLLFGFGHDPVVVEVKVSDLLHLVKEVILPVAIRTFIVFSRCTAALELLRVCTTALEAAEQAFVTPVEKWVERSMLCWRPAPTAAQLDPCLWQELALSRAAVLETRAKLMLRGGQFDIADDLIRKAVFIRASISGDDHTDTVAARETLGKITRLLANVQIHSSI